MNKLNKETKDSYVNVEWDNTLKTYVPIPWESEKIETSKVGLFCRFACYILISSLLSLGSYYVYLLTI